MEPFKIPTPLAKLKEHYPDAKLVSTVATEGGEQARIAIARLWLSEGIPFAFANCPGVYETVRTWLGGRLAVDAKAINLTGSARLGSSLAPEKLGNPFNEDSDLDIFVVSKDLFERLRRDFQQWSDDFEEGRVKPRNKREEGFWRDINSRVPNLIQRGYIPPKKIPNLDPYRTIKQINQAMYLLIEKLKVTERAPRVKEASLRCYESWDACVRRMTINLA